MTADDLITDPLLLSVLQSAAQAREQSLAILDLISDFHTSTQDSNQQQLELSKQQTLLTTHLASLRALNRKAILAVRSTKTSTTSARQEIDTLHLQLQNLYYEQRHLRGEIAACESYEHTYEKIQMVPAEEFLEQHQEFVGQDEHEVTVARIEDEHRQRLALEADRQVLVKKKAEVGKETGAKKEELAKLDAEMEKWVGLQEGVRGMFEAREKKMEEAS